MPDAAAGSLPELPPIKGFIETSFLDWKSQISSVLFLPGCNFACPYCHNYSLVTEPDSFVTLPADAVMDRLRPFVGWIDGVVVSGGEPTLHPGLERLLDLLHKTGFKVKLDTNGYRPSVVKDLVERGLVDMVAMDLKAPLEPLAYRRACGKSIQVQRVAESLDYLRASGVAHEIRSTIAPGWHTDEVLELMASQVAGCQAWTLQAMKPETAWNAEAVQGAGAYSAPDIKRLQAKVADPVCRGPIPA